MQKIQCLDEILHHALAKEAFAMYVSPLRSSEPGLMSTENRNNAKAPNALLSAADAW